MKTTPLSYLPAEWLNQTNGRKDLPAQPNQWEKSTLSSLYHTSWSSSILSIPQSFNKHASIPKFLASSQMILVSLGQVTHVKVFWYLWPHRITINLLWNSYLNRSHPSGDLLTLSENWSCLYYKEPVKKNNISRIIPSKKLKL